MFFEYIEINIYINIKSKFDILLYNFYLIKLYKKRIYLVYINYCRSRIFDWDLICLFLLVVYVLIDEIKFMMNY